MGAEISISVIICTRNRANYLTQCLRSIAAQKCSAPFEVVVINNGSTDHTGAVIEEWCAKDSRFRTAQEYMPGLSRAKNCGVKVACGTILAFTDDDVIVEPNWLQTYCEFFAKNLDDIVVAGGAIIPVPEDLGKWPNWFDEQALCNVGLLDYHTERSLENWEYLWGANIAVPKRLFTKIGMWDESVGRKGDERGTFEDVEFQDRIKTAGGRSWFCPRAVVHHRVDRRTITPRRILTMAFTRGMNEFTQDSFRRWGDFGLAPKRQLIVCLTKLAVKLSLWTFLTFAYRLFSSRRLFERARRAAWSCGWGLCILRSSRTSTRLCRVIASCVFRVRTFVLLLTPNVSRR